MKSQDVIIYAEAFDEIKHGGEIMYKMPLGVESFRDLVEGGYVYVDKTYFIQELLDNGIPVTLLTRPRRFGKTLTLSMVKEFFDIKNKDKNIFEGLRIAKAGEEYMKHRGKYPVVLLSLKEATGLSYEEAKKTFCRKLSDLYAEYEFLRESPKLSQRDKAYFESIYKLPDAREYEDDKWKISLKQLMVFLYKHYRAKPILLVDEYDAPIQSAWENGYYEQMITFVRAMYSEALKTNEALNFALLTGVLRVAKESIFSGLNNLMTCSVLSEEYNDAIGFTYEEVAKLAETVGRQDKLPEIKDWYDGYNFGGAEIYNPWSVIQYFQAKCKPGAYWVNTSANGIIRRMMQDMSKSIERQLQRLMDGGSVWATVHESIVYAEIGDNADDLYSMLMNTGYLKAVNTSEGDREDVELQIPNKEIFSLFRTEICRNLNGYRGITYVRHMLDSMLAGDLDEFDMNLESILKNNASYHDTANGESFYHGMMLGFCVLLKDTHIVKSNRESGYGRFDLALLPKSPDGQGVILEFKRAESEAQLQEKAKEALQQIMDMEYLVELQERQIHKVWKYGIAFYGKRIAMECEA